MAVSGANTDNLAEGARTLKDSSNKLESLHQAVTTTKSKGSSGSAGSPVADSLARFGATYGPLINALSVQVDALGTLASHTGEDIQAATSGGSHRRDPRIPDIV